MNVTISNALATTSYGDQQQLRKLLELLLQRKFEVEVITQNPQRLRERFAGIAAHEQPGLTLDRPERVRSIVARWRLLITLLSPWLPGIYRLLPHRQRDAVASLRNAELIVASPGGYLADPALPVYPQLAELWVAAMARAPLVIAPISIGEFDGRLQRWLLRRILSRARHVFVRETKSEMVCRDLGINAILSNDIGFLNKAFGHTADPVPINAEPTHIAVTAINWHFPGHNRDEAKCRYLDAMVATVGAVARHRKLPVKLIVQDDSDMNTVRQLANSLTVPVEILPNVNTPEELNALLLNSYCLVASRFSSATMALATGCPVAVLTRHPGHRSMLHLYGLDDLGMPIDSFDADTLSAMLIRWGDDRTGFRQRCASLRDSLRRVGDPFVDCLYSANTLP